MNIKEVKNKLWDGYNIIAKEIEPEVADNQKGWITYGNNSNSKKSDFIDAMEENQKDVRKMVMDSYRDIKKGKGKDYKEFFAELERRYRNANI